MALMMTAGVLALMSSYLVPVTYDANSLLVPSLLARIQLLENNARTAPRLAFGAGLLARGAGVIGSRTFRDYMDWRKLNPPTYAASGRSGWAASYGSSGWGGWEPSTDAARRLKWLHEMYERNSVRGTQRGHRAIDFLAFAFARSRKRMRVRMAERLKLAQEWLARRAARAEAQAAGGDGWGAEVVYSGGWSGGGVTVVQEPAPVVTEVVGVAPAPVPVHYSSVEEPVGYGPAYGPTTDDAGPSYGSSYGPSSYGSYEGPSSYGSGYSSGSGYGSPSKGQYYSSAAAAGHSSYGGGHSHGSYGSYSSYSPSRTSASSSSRGGYSRSSKPKREQEQLSPSEFMSLMDWAEGKPLDYTPAASGPRNVRIKRQHTKPKTRAPVPAGSSASAFLPGLVDDVGRFFTVIEFLDENKCLQKFVCNVHSRARSYLPAPMVKGGEGAKSAVENMSPFESSIVAAFKVLDTFMPVDDESYRGYRDAALAGAKAANETACTKQYRSCKYSTAEIIEMNDQIEAQALAAEKLKAKAKTTKAPTTVSTTTTTGKPAVKKQPKNKKKVKTTSTSTTAATTTTTAAPTTLLPEEYEYDDESEETSTEVAA